MILLQGEVVDINIHHAPWIESKERGERERVGREREVRGHDVDPLHA